MRIHLVGVDYLTAPLTALASLAPADELALTVMGREPGIAGAALLSTCNRYELIVDATDAVDPDRLLGLAKAGIRELAPDVDPRALAGLEVRSDDTAICHLFEVGAGLCSAVVGDKQVAGQLRRAYELASDRGQCTARLHRLFHDCLRVSRTVASSTSLGAVGRSAAGVGLDLAMGRGGLRGARVLLMGTGSFARVVVAELTDRRVGEIECWSASGRAEEFAAHHPVTPVSSDGLDRALQSADLVITCSGNGVVLSGTTLSAARPELARNADRQLSVIDLSLGGDVDEAAAELPGVHLVRLDDVSSRTAQLQSAVIEEAQRVVTQGVAAHLSKERARAADPLVTALRQHAKVLVDDELARVRENESPGVVQAVERSLRHAIGVMMHTPTVRFSQLAEEGKLEDCRTALDVLFGVEVEA
ncbi:glutamyl-tRNA reductase [Propionibacterium freudenreichii]|uniref:glutamyl-tRNA reductase n=1 Tax=Propionibacterium freudenreichii TaxID=1744 RepID=UPI00254BCE12|nr:glutamyl-tRNA reductase [Propionibacterium freudenreichii]MDK9343386.1 glutamyl-tRNA reductase [Propionibacterium freudenreichii]